MHFSKHSSFPLGIGEPFCIFVVCPLVPNFSGVRSEHGHFSLSDTLLYMQGGGQEQYLWSSLGKIIKFGAN